MGEGDLLSAFEITKVRKKRLATDDADERESEGLIQKG